MATTTYDAALAGDRAATETKTSFLGRMFERFIAARESEARRRVAVYLTTFSDQDLAAAGLSARDIEIMRQGGKIDPELAS